MAVRIEIVNLRLGKGCRIGWHYLLAQDVSGKANLLCICISNPWNAHKHTQCART